MKPLLKFEDYKIGQFYFIKIEEDFQELMMHICIDGKDSVRNTITGYAHMATIHTRTTSPVITKVKRIYIDLENDKVIASKEEHDHARIFKQVLEWMITKTDSDDKSIYEYKLQIRQLKDELNKEYDRGFKDALNMSIREYIKLKLSK